MQRYLRKPFPSGSMVRFVLLCKLVQERKLDRMFDNREQTHQSVIVKLSINIEKPRKKGGGRDVNQGKQMTCESDEHITFSIMCGPTYKTKMYAAGCGSRVERLIWGQEVLVRSQALWNRGCGEMAITLHLH